MRLDFKKFTFLQCSLKSLTKKPIAGVNMDQNYFDFKIEKAPPTTNSWAICVGWVPTTFKIAHAQRWVGAQHSYGFIGGTGVSVRFNGVFGCFFVMSRLMLSGGL